MVSPPSSYVRPGLSRIARGPHEWHAGARWLLALPPTLPFPRVVTRCSKNDAAAGDSVPCHDSPSELRSAGRARLRQGSLDAAHGRVPQFLVHLPTTREGRWEGAPKLAWPCGPLRPVSGHNLRGVITRGWSSPVGGHSPQGVITRGWSSPVGGQNLRVVITSGWSSPGGGHSPRGVRRSC